MMNLNMNTLYLEEMPTAEEMKTFTDAELKQLARIAWEMRQNFLMVGKERQAYNWLMYSNEIFTISNRHWGE